MAEINYINGYEIVDGTARSSSTDAITKANNLNTQLNSEIATRTNADANLQSQINSLASGSPIAVSSISEMTDTSKIYVNTNDGKWYYYGDDSWEIGGVYQANVASTEEYTRKMFGRFSDLLQTVCDFVNIVPTLTWTDGYFYNTSGVQTVYGGAECTEISVVPGDMYFLSGYNAVDGKVYNLLDSNDTVIEYPTDSGDNGYFVIIPDNAVKIQLNHILKSTHSFSIKKVNSLKIKDEEFQNFLNEYSLNSKYIDLLNFATFENGKIWGNTGELTDLSRGMASSKIRIPENTTKLIFKTKRPGNLACLFDENKNFLRAIIGDSDHPELELEYILEGDEKYVSINLIKPNQYIQHVYSDAFYELSNEEKTDIDLFLFMGQSNMCGQGNADLAPIADPGVGYEYSNTSGSIFPIHEPAGAYDNTATNGSLITAFANSYYKQRKIPIVAIMCAVSGSGIDEWQPNTTYLNRALTSLNNAVSYLTQNNYNIKNINMVWLQGEHEGARGESSTYYKTMFNNMWQVLKDAGVKHCFLIRIGEYNGTSTTVDFSTIIQAQTEMCQDNDDIIMATTTLASMKDRNLMNDQYHMSQVALNEAGSYAGINSAFYLNNNKEPNMYDYKYNNLYYSHIN